MQNCSRICFSQINDPQALEALAGHTEVLLGTDSLSECGIYYEEIVKYVSARRHTNKTKNVSNLAAEKADDKKSAQAQEAEHLICGHVLSLAVSDVTDTKSKMDILCQKLKRGTLKEIKDALAETPDINSESTKGETALGCAIAARRENEILELLIATKANVNAGERRGISLLIFAISQAQYESAALLIKAGSDVNALNAGDHRRPLHLATEVHCAELVKLLLKYGANVNARNCVGQSALAVVLSQLKKIATGGKALVYLHEYTLLSEIFWTLLAHGADLKATHRFLMNNGWHDTELYELQMANDPDTPLRHPIFMPRRPPTRSPPMANWMAPSAGCC